MHYSIEPRDRIYVKGNTANATNTNTAKNIWTVLRNLRQLKLRQMQ